MSNRGWPGLTLVVAARSAKRKRGKMDVDHGIEPDEVPSKRTFERTLSSTSASTLVEDSDAETVAGEGAGETYISTKGQETYANIYAHARTLLRCSAHTEGMVARTLVGRQEERGTIAAFLRDRLVSGGQPASLYIAGTPGTGKTALVCDVVSTFMRDSNTDVVVLNCVALASASDVYAKMLSLFPVMPTRGKPAPARSTPAQTSEQILLARLASPARNTIIVLDEMDSLLRQGAHQDVLYQIFLAVSSASAATSASVSTHASASRGVSRTALIGIANSLDLADQFLPLLAGHGAYPQLLSFKPFKADEIVSVVTDRLAVLRDGDTGTDEVPIFTKPGLRLAAMKVAAVTGDLRKALDVCRLAIETVEIQQKNKGVDLAALTASSAVRVGPPQVLTALARALATGGTTAAGASTANAGRVRALPLHAGLLLACYLLVEMKHTHLGPKGSKIDVSAVYDTYTRILNDDGCFSPLPLGEVLDILANLETQAFIDLAAPRTAVTPTQVRGASKAALAALAKRMPRSGAPVLGARSRVVTLRLPAEDVRRGLTDGGGGAAAGSGKTVAAETIARLMHSEHRRIVRAQGWEEAAAGFKETRAAELGGGRLAVAHGL